MTVTLPIELGGPTRGRIVELAYAAMGMGEVEAEELVDALKVLDAMMTTHPWNGLGYDRPGYSEGLPTDPTGIPDDCLAGVYHELAMRLAPTKGKTPNPAFMANYGRETGFVRSKVSATGLPQMKRHLRTFAGQGTRRWDISDPYLIPDE